MQDKDSKEARAALHRSLAGGTSFLVVRGHVFFTIGWKRPEILPLEGKEWGRHGKFSPLYVGGDYALLEHTMNNGTTMPLFIPPQRRMLASNGRFLNIEVNYESFVFAFDNNTTLVGHLNRNDCGHYFVWDSLVGGWLTTGGEVACVIPPIQPGGDWKVLFYATRKLHTVTGKGAEGRAFSIAELYSRSK